MTRVRAIGHHQELLALTKLSRLYLILMGTCWWLFSMSHSLTEVRRSRRSGFLQADYKGAANQ